MISLARLHMLFLLSYLSSVNTVITLLPNFFHLVCTMGKEYVKAVYCHPTYLTSMQSTLCEMLDVKCECDVAQLCPTLSDPLDCSLPGSSVHGIFLA